jgi:hypothetical protein
MTAMFSKASTFNQDLSGWNVGQVAGSEDFSDGANNWTLSKPNFN